MQTMDEKADLVEKLLGWLYGEIQQEKEWQNTPDTNLQEVQDRFHFGPIRYRSEARPNATYTHKPDSTVRFDENVKRLPSIETSCPVKTFTTVYFIQIMILTLNVIVYFLPIFLA